MTACIKCANCGAVSYYDEKTKIHCITCYDQLKAENEKLKEALKIIVKIAGKFEWWSELGIKTNNGESVIDMMEQTAQQALNEVTK